MRGPSLSTVGARPPLWREARIGLEAAALVRDPIFRGDGMADGRGRPVLLIPGFLAGDGSLSMMAGWLKRTGYRPSRAGIVANVNCAGVLLPRLEERLERLVQLQGSAQPWWARAAEARWRRCSRGGGRISCRAWWPSARRRSDPLAVHPLVRLQVEAVSRLGSLGAPGPLQALVPDGDCCSSLLGATWRGRSPSGIPLRVGLLEERRRRGLALLPRPARDRAGRDRRLPLRHGGVTRRVASRGRGARGLPRGRRPASPAAGRAGAPASARRLAHCAPGDRARRARAHAPAVAAAADHAGELEGPARARGGRIGRGAPSGSAPPPACRSGPCKGA